MRILLDENVPRRLKQHLPADWSVRTVPEQGWSGKQNGELLELSQTEFDVFVTMDRGVEYQQNLVGFDLTVILLRAASNRLADLIPLVPDVLSTLESMKPGELRVVPAG